MVNSIRDTARRVKFRSSTHITIKKKKVNAHTHFILSFCASILFADIFNMRKRLTNVLVGKCQSYSMMEATVLILISVTEVLRLSHSGVL